MKESDDSTVTDLLKEFDLSSCIEESGLDVSTRIVVTSNHLDGNLFGNDTIFVVGCLLVLTLACQNHRGKSTVSEYTDWIIRLRDLSWPFFWYFHSVFRFDFSM